MGFGFEKVIKGFNKNSDDELASSVCVFFVCFLKESVYVRRCVWRLKFTFVYDKHSKT